jgi:hypothetical protein
VQVEAAGAGRLAARLERERGDLVVAAVLLAEGDRLVGPEVVEPFAVAVATVPLGVLADRGERDRRCLP